MLSGLWFWSGGWLADWIRASQELLIPLWASACFPGHAAKVAKLMTAAAVHMEATLGKLHHVPTFGALLPLCPLRCIHEELHMWVARTQSVMCAVFALHAGRLVAVDAGAYIGADIFDPNESGAIDVCAICRIGCRELLHLEVELLDVSLRKHGTTYVQWDWNIAAFRRKDRDVFEGPDEEVMKTDSTIAMSHRLAFERQSVYGRYFVETRLAKSEGLFRVWF